MFLHKNIVRVSKQGNFLKLSLGFGIFFLIEEVNVYMIKYPDSTKSYTVKSNSSTPVFFFFNLQMEVIGISGADESCVNFLFL